MLRARRGAREHDYPVPLLRTPVSQSYTPPSMEDGPTRTHTLHTIGSGADTRHAVTGRSTGSGLLDAQHTAHRTAHEVALYSGVLRDRHGRRRWSTGTGTQNSRTDIPPRAGCGGARERRGIWTRSLAGARPQIRRQSLQAASAIRAGSQKRSGAVLTASSQRTTEFTMMSEEKRCSCGTMRESHNAALRFAALLLQRARGGEESASP